MRYLAGFVAVGTLSLSAAAPLAAAQAAPLAASLTASTQSQAVTGLNAGQAQISGRVITPNGNPLAGATVRARNLIDGQIGGSTSTASSGQFAININPGSYLVEVVDDGGQIIGTSPFIAATAGTAITGATVTVSAGAVTTTAGLASTLGTTVARSLTYAAAAAGVAGVVSPANAVTASPSR